VNDVSVRGRGAYFEAADALVVADLHLGRDEASGVAFPLGAREDLTERLAGLVSRFDPASVVVAGDVLHTFGRVGDGAREGLRELRAVCRDGGARPVLVAGNHDGLLSEVWDGDVHDSYRLEDGSLVVHGHEPPGAEADRYVIGHDHPAITVEGVRHPCLLYGPEAYRGADVAVLPAFNRLAPGAEVNGMRAGDFQSPLVRELGAFRPVVYDADAEDTLRFPPLSEFRELL